LSGKIESLKRKEKNRTRMIQYKCDTCKAVTSDKDQVIELGSEDNSLYFNNPKAKVGQTNNIARYRDLHFCDQTCFIKYFFDKEEE